MILLASANAGLRRRWKRALQRRSAIHEVATRPGLNRSLADLRPSILLLDLGLPHLGGVGTLRAIQRLSPPTKIVLFTSTPDESEGIFALQAGARGYCTTDTDLSLVQKAVEMVQKGEIWVRRSLVLHLLEALASRTDHRKKPSPARGDARLSRLTPREREIVHLIGAGASNKEIASQLTVSERTVKAHLTAIFRKVGVPDRLRLALYVAEQMREPR